MEELRELIQYWKDYRCNSGLPLNEFQKVNDTIINLEKLLRLLGILGYSHRNFHDLT